MKILVVGARGREHAIIKKLKENPEVTEIFACPGNGGIAKDAECVNISATDLNGITDFAVKMNIDFCVVAPDDPLVLDWWIFSKAREYRASVRLKKRP